MVSNRNGPLCMGRKKGNGACKGLAQRKRYCRHHKEQAAAAAAAAAHVALRCVCARSCYSRYSLTFMLASKRAINVSI